MSCARLVFWACQIRHDPKTKDLAPKLRVILDLNLIIMGLFFLSISLYYALDKWSIVVQKGKIDFY